MLSAWEMEKGGYLKNKRSRKGFRTEKWKMEGGLVASMESKGNEMECLWS